MRTVLSEQQLNRVLKVFAKFYNLDKLDFLFGVNHTDDMSIADMNGNVVDAHIFVINKISDPFHYVMFYSIAQEEFKHTVEEIHFCTVTF